MIGYHMSSHSNDRWKTCPTKSVTYIWVMINSLAPGRPGCHFKTAIFNLALSIGIFTLSNDNPLRWMPWDLLDDKSTLVQVMAWCHHQQAITWANVDIVPYRHVASWGHNVLRSVNQANIKLTGPKKDNTPVTNIIQFSQKFRCSFKRSWSC